MRKDLNNMLYHPKMGAPMYYQDLSMIAWVWYFHNRLEEVGSHFEINVQTMNNLSSTTRCSYFMENASGIEAMSEYFADVHNTLDYNVMADHFGWKKEVANFDHHGRVLSTADYEAAVAVYVNLASSAMRLFAAYLGRCMNLMRHWTYLVDSPTKHYKQWVEEMKPVQTVHNPFIEGCISMSGGLVNTPYAYAFLTCVTNTTKIVPTSLAIIYDRKNWMSPMIPYALLGDHRKYKLNNFAAGDEINFVS